jgi:hypothetical protein
MISGVILAVLTHRSTKQTSLRGLRHAMAAHIGRKSVNKDIKIMPQFIFGRRGDIEQAENLLFAGLVVTHFPIQKEPNEADWRKIRKFIDQLAIDALAGRLGVVCYAWEGLTVPPNAVETPMPSSVIEQWMETHASLWVRVEVLDDGTLKIQTGEDFAAKRVEAARKQ